MRVPSSHEAQLEALRRENQRLSDRIEELEYDLQRARGLSEPGEVWREPPELLLTKKEARVLRLLAERAPTIVTKQSALDYLYESMDEAQIKIVDVFICKIRAKIKGLPVEIETIWGQGYVMSREHGERWMRWCRSVGAGSPPGEDFVFAGEDDEAGFVEMNRPLMPLEMMTITKRLRRGDSPEQIAERLCLQVAIVERVRGNLQRVGRLSKPDLEAA